MSENGIHCSPQKISTIIEWPIPKNKAALRSFVGLCSYYRQYVKDCAAIAKPLHKICDIKTPFVRLFATLSQFQNGVEKVIAYYSKCLNNAEKNYCVTRKERLAVIKAGEAFSHYLLGRKFTIRTDHAALKWLVSFKNPVNQIARWIAFLFSYDFEITHRPGHLHGNADALSRRPCTCKICLKANTIEDSNKVVFKTICCSTSDYDWSKL